MRLINSLLIEDSCIKGLNNLLMFQEIDTQEIQDQQTEFINNSLIKCLTQVDKLNN